MKVRVSEFDWRIARSRSEYKLNAVSAATLAEAVAFGGTWKAMPPSRIELNDSVRNFTPSESMDMSMPLACQKRVDAVMKLSKGLLTKILMVTLAPPGSSA